MSGGVKFSPHTPPRRAYHFIRIYHNMVAANNKRSSNVLQTDNPLQKTHNRASQLGIYGSIASPTQADIQLINRYSLQCHAREIIPAFAIQHCQRRIIPLKTNETGEQVKNRMEVDIFVSATNSKAFYGNVVTCKSVWVCPVCASKITERRRQDLTEALTRSRDMGHYHLLASYTVSHQKRDTLRYVADGMRNAFRKLKSGKSWQLFKNRYNWLGDIKSTEITHGANGWHFHFHQIIVLESKPTPGQEIRLKQELKTRWRQSLGREGKYANWTNGLDIRPTDDFVGDYVQKIGNWTVEHEMTKAPAKTGKQRGRTPLQLLLDYATTGEIEARQLFREYALFTKRKNQLYWSLGLRELLGMEKEKTDEELADETEDNAILLAILDKADWLMLQYLQLRGHALIEARAAYEADDFGLFDEWLKQTRTKYLASRKNKDDASDLE